MKINNEIITRMARQLRDEENTQLHVAPWQRHRRHFRVPAWLVALPAAALVGFFFGLWTNSEAPADSPLTALVDTVYVTEEKPSTPKDTATSKYANQPTSQPAIQSAALPTTSTRQRMPSHPSKSPRATTAGHSVADDHIRYDLLVRY